jgi:CRP-like cAMP-binding protein
MDRRRLLESVSIFDGLAQRELDLLLECTTTKHLGAKEVLFHKGDPGNQLFGILSGRLKVMATGCDGKEVVFGLMGPGEVIGEIALMDSNPRSATVAALEDSRLLTLHRRDLIPFLERHPSVAIHLAAVLAARLRRLSQHTEDTFFLTLAARTARKLLELEVEYGKVEGKPFELRLPQQELADMVGTTRESINKQLRDWEQHGLVALGRARVTILDHEAMEAIANLISV